MRTDLLFPRIDISEAFHAARADFYVIAIDGDVTFFTEKGENFRRQMCLGIALHGAQPVYAVLGKQHRPALVGQFQLAIFFKAGEFDAA